ncbi:MAG TPA: class I SAM-dependent methyltransferase [Pyrinomonadaceae bacterium]|nr:class I SAM-dependent methyltransferase [Pyrinomonadaceae bacterium]
MDEIAEYNVERWRRLVEAGALFTRPLLNLDAASARATLDPRGWIDELEGRRVLCLAGGGGRESAAFALLGASVTVFDLSEEQLGQDRRAAAHYGLEVETIQGDMRDLSRLHGAGFDLVWHSYSLNFVPEARAVFREVARVVRPFGLYRVMCANPFVMGATTKDWDGRGYALTNAYVDGAEVEGADEDWVYEHAGREQVRPPREYRHGLGTLVGGLAEHGFRLLRASEDESLHPKPDAEPGTWDHFVSIVRPWLTLLSHYDPEASTP